MSSNFRCMTHIFQQNVLQNLNSLCLADTVLVIFSTTLGSSDKFVTPWTGSVVAGYCPLWAWLHSHQPARFCFWELTKQLPRVVTHPGIAPASNSLNFGVPTNPKPVSSQKASSKVALIPNCHTPDPLRRSRRLSALGLATFSPARTQLPRVVTHPGIAPASNSLNFGVLTNPKPVSSQKASS
ncbi:cyclic nucleotide gated channel 1, partial [Prunus dulcis]